MHWMIICFLISAIINIILYYIIHNCSYEKYNRKTQEYTYVPLKFPAYVYLIAFIVTLVPILQFFGNVAWSALLIMYCEDENVVLNPDFWMKKEY